MKKLFLSLVASYMLFVMSISVIKAEEQTCVAVTQYGGSVSYVCGTKHEPVETGLADVNPLVIASIFFVLAGGSFVKARKIARAEISL